MIVYGDRKFISSNFESEKKLETVVEMNAEYIFGADSIYLPKTLIKSAEGFGTIPDGFAVDLESRRWFIVEAELASHSIWTHIAPQVARQIVAASQPSSRRILTEIVINRFREDDTLKERFEELGIQQLDIRRVLTEIFESPPIMAIPIGAVGTDLREWAQTLKYEVKLWIIRKLVEFGNPTNVLYEIPDDYRPAFDTTPDIRDDIQTNQYYEVSVSDLISSGLLTADQSLYMSYGPRNGEKKHYEAHISADGSFSVLGETFAKPSYAALLCIRNAGSPRSTVNGWTSWKTAARRSLAELREEYLAKISDPGAEN